MTRDGFLHAIRDTPDDDAPRLVFADWLDEHGEPGRAEFIRLQCRMARLQADMAAIERGQRLERRPGTAEETAREGELLREFTALQGHEGELLNRNRGEWLGPLPDRVDGWWFRRGLLGVRLHGDWLEHPLRRLRLFLGGSVFASLLDESPARAAWAWADELILREVGDGLLADLAASPHAAVVTSLTVFLSNVGPRGVRAVAESPHLSGLRKLDLGANRIGPEGARALASSPHLAGLTSLSLRQNAVGDPGIGDEGARALADSPHLTRLSHLDLASNGIGTVGALALASSPRLPRSLWLHLQGNPCEEVAERLAARFERVTWGFWDFTAPRTVVPGRTPSAGL